MMWFLLVLPVSLAYPFGFSSSQNEDGFELASENLRKSLNLSADPCSDFFNFACGRWIEDNPIPADKPSIGQLELIMENVTLQMKSLFESEVRSSSKAITMVKSIYKKCMKVDLIAATGVPKLLAELEDFGFFPMIHNDLWNKNSFNLTELLINVRLSKSISVFVDYSVIPDIKNVTRRLLYFVQGGLGLGSRQMYVQPKLFRKQITAFKNLIFDMVRQLTADSGLPVNLTKIAMDVDEFFEFEKKFAEITVENNKDFESMYNPVNLSQMKELMPLIDWDTLLYAVIPPIAHPYLASNPTIIVTDLDFMKRITKLLTETDPRVITNYILTQLMMSWSSELGLKYEEIGFKFIQEFAGIKERPPRWQRCVGRSSSMLSMASGAMYIREYFSEDTKTRTSSMIESVQKSFESILSGSDWMANVTKKYALEKLDKLQKLVGYPDYMHNDKELDTMYERLDITDDDTLADANRKVTEFSRNNSFIRLLEPIDRTEFLMSPAIVNALYSPTINTIVFLAAFLQLPLFHKNYPYVLNYGGLGSIIGHEITHGFDDTGRLFDKIGNLVGWWDNKTAAAFAEKAKCFIDQYGSIEIPGTKQRINGLLTLGENIADNGGVKEAYMAFKKFEKESGPERPIPGFEQYDSDKMFYIGYAQAFKKFEKESGPERPIPGFEQYDSDKMFYIGYAQPWCSHTTPEMNVLTLLSDPHSPNTYRVNTVLSNQPEFAKAFNCPTNSPMNPEKRCSVW